MIIDFLSYIEAKQSQIVATQAAHDAEMARRAQLENILTDLLADLLAA